MPVRAWVGPFGSGKTYCAVMDAWGRRKREPDLPIMTNLGRLDLPGAPVETISVDDGLENMWARMAGFREGILFLDEVGVFLPSRMWAHIPLELQAKWAQLRKDGIELYTTAITISSMVKDLRDITWETNVCSSWQRFGFFLIRTYSGTRVGDKRFYQGFHVRPFRPGVAGKLYDTMGKVKAPQWAGKKVQGGSVPAMVPAVDGHGSTGLVTDVPGLLEIPNGS